MASTTNRISSGSTASLMSAAWRIISSSMPSRPAVSTITMLCSRWRASSSDWRAPPRGAPPAFAGGGGDPRHARALADDLELLDRVGPLQVRRDEQRGVALLTEPEPQFRGERGLAGTLQASQHDHGRRHLGEPQPARLATEDPHEFLVDDLDDLLRRVQRGGDLFAGGTLLHPGDELPDHRKRYVRSG